MSLAGAPVWLTRPTYQAASAPADWPNGWDSFDKGAWAKAQRIDRFYSLGEGEADDGRTEAKMLSSGDKLTVFVRCHEPEPQKIKKDLPPADSDQEDSVELFMLARGASNGKFIRVTVDAGGWSGERQIIPSAMYGDIVAETLPVGMVTSAAGAVAQGYWVAVELPLDKLGLTGDELRMNILRNRRADGSHFAWVDLWGGRARNVHRLGRVATGGGAAAWPAVELPATLSVGSNSLKLSGWRDGFVLKVCGRPAAVDAKGVAAIEITQHGPVELSVCRAGAKEQELDVYGCDVRRPLLIQAPWPFIEELPKSLAVEVVLDVAGAEVPLAIEAWQGDKKIGQIQAKLPSGVHKVDIPLESAKEGEVSLVATAEVSVAGKKQSVSARHWCMIGTPAKKLDCFRDGIEKLPTQSLVRAAVCDAGDYWRIVQKGDGSFTKSTSPWPQGITYLMAVLYKTGWPENRHLKDERFLASAAAGMEASLDPSRRQRWLNEPDNRSLQALLRTYEMLKEDVPPEQAQRWKASLTEITQAVLETWIEPAKYRMSRYSADVGTGTNHWAFHAANVYTAGRIFDSKEWFDEGISQMRQLARQEADGQFAERKGVPTLSYNWLTQTAMIEYFLQSGDKRVEPAVKRCGEFAWRSNVANGRQLMLHDGRVNGHTAGSSFPLAMSISPQGRRVARECLLSQISGRSPSAMTPEAWHRWAELAVAMDALPATDEAAGPAEDELSFMDGRALVVKKKGFCYGLSAICLPPIKDQLFRLDPQNAMELYQSRVGWILCGNNSQDQPEAGSFCRKVGGKNVWLPTEGQILRTDGGHAATLTFDGFKVRAMVSVLSEDSAEVRVELLEADGAEPVMFNFFPGGQVQLSDDKLQIRSPEAVITGSSAIELQKDFKIFNPYTGKYDMNVKPARAYVALEKGKAFVLKVKVEESHK